MTVLWDIDGTLLRAGDPDHIGGLAAVLSEAAGRPITIEGVPLGGNVERRICRMALAAGGVPEPHDTIVTAAIAELCDRYEAAVTDRRERVLPGVPGALAACATAGMLQGVLTGGARRIARHKLDTSGLAAMLSFGAYGDEAETRPELVAHALDEAEALTGRRPASTEVVVVGDTPADVHAARDAGVAVVCVATGRWSVADLAAEEPDGLLADLADPAAVVAALSLAAAGLS